MAPQVPQSGCGPGCGSMIVGFVVLVFAFAVFGSSCGPDTSSVPSTPSRPAPVDPQPGLPGLCEGRDFVEYDDCKQW